MNKLTKSMAVATAAVLIGFGGWATTSANAATDDEIADYLAEAVAAQLGITNSDALRELIADAMANNLLAPSVTDAAGNTVDGVSTLTAEELAALLDSNLTQQLGTIEQQLLDLGFTDDDDDDYEDEAEDDADDAADEAEDDADDAADEAEDDADDAADEAEDDADDAADEAEDDADDAADEAEDDADDAADEAEDDADED
jgi:hypothetical protein